MNKACRYIIFLIGSLLSIKAYSQSTIIEESHALTTYPDKNLSVQFYQKKDENNKRVMYNQVSFNGKPIISEYVLDIRLDNHLSEHEYEY